MKTCKYGCGKMKDGGKVTAVKKMAKGGSAGCPPGQCPKYVGGKREGCKPCSGGIIAGITAGISGIAGVAGKMISDAAKKRKAIKELKKSNPAMTTKEARQKLASKDTEEKRKGGATKKYQAGGSTIVGMPQYSNNPRTYSGRMLQAGGSFAPNRAVQSSCKGGMVRDENGRCVTARKMQKGGDTSSAQIKKGENLLKNLINKKSTMTPEEYNKIKKNGVNITPKKKMQKGGFPDLNKDGKITKADILKGRGVIKKLGGAKKR